MKKNRYWLMCLLTLLSVGSWAVGDSPVVIDHDFSESVDPAWTSEQTVPTLENERALGPFTDDTVGVRLDDLPRHRLLHIQVDVAALGAWRGLSASPRWTLQVDGGRPLVSAAFHNGDANPRRARQRIVAAATAPRAGSKATGKRGDPAEQNVAIYTLHFWVPHSARQARLFFTGDGFHAKSDCAWAIDRLTVRASDRPGDPLTERQMIQAWDGLSKDDLERVTWFMGQLQLSGESAAHFLHGRLIDEEDVARFDRLMSKLESKNFQTREDATRILKQIGSTIHPELRRALSSAGLEKAWRIREILSSPGRGGAAVLDIDLKQHLRAVQTIRRIGGPAAGEALDAVATRTKSLEVAAAARSAQRQLREQRVHDLARAGQFDRAEALSKQFANLGRTYIESRRRHAQLVERQQKIIESARRAPKDFAEDPAARQYAAWLLLTHADASDAAAAIDLGSSAAARELRQAIARATDADDSPEARYQHAEWLLDQIGQYEASDRMRVLEHADDYALTAQRAAGSASERRLAASARSLRKKIAHRMLETMDSQIGWVDVLAMWEKAAMEQRGTWQRTDAGVVVNAGEAFDDFAMTRLPILPTGSYEMKIRFQRLKGEEGIFIAIPVGNHDGNLNLGGWGGGFSGFEVINGALANENPTTVRDRFAVGRTYELHIHVNVGRQKSTVRVTLDGKPYLTWTGDPSGLSRSHAWNIGGKRSLAVGAHRCRVAFERLEVRAISGTLERVRK